MNEKPFLCTKGVKFPCMRGEVKPILKNSCHFTITLILLFFLVHEGFRFSKALTLSAALLHGDSQIPTHEFLIFKLYKLN